MLEDQTFKQDRRDAQAVAREFGVTPRTLRFYEEKGLLKSERSGRVRLYSSHDRSRLALILRYRGLGFSLDDICEILGVIGTDEGGSKGYLVGRLAGHLDTLEEELAEVEERISGTMAALKKLGWNDHERRPRETRG